MVSTRGNNIFHFPIESYVKTLSSRCGHIGQLRQIVFREQYKEQSFQGTIPWQMWFWRIFLKFKQIIITLLPFFIEMLQYDWLWSGHMIIKEMFYIPIKLKPKLARASMTTSDVNNQWRSNFQQQIKFTTKNSTILNFGVI